jgi:hypothetical protein
VAAVRILGAVLVDFEAKPALPERTVHAEA